MLWGALYEDKVYNIEAESDSIILPLWTIEMLHWSTTGYNLKVLSK